MPLRSFAIEFLFKIEGMNIIIHYFLQNDRAKIDMKLVFHEYNAYGQMLYLIEAKHPLTFQISSFIFTNILFILVIGVGRNFYSLVNMVIFLFLVNEVSC
jgi:hypothetical protein